MRVIQFCPDENPSSGVNFFCRELDAALNAGGSGVASVVVRGLDELAALPVGSERLVLHVHGLWLRAQHGAAAWARKRGVPVVWSTHGMTAPWSMRHKRWKKLPAWWLYQKRDLEGAAAIHCTTDLEVDWNRVLGLTRTFVAPLGCSSKSEVRSSKSEVGVFTLLFVGRIYPVKGLANLIRAYALVVQNQKKTAYASVQPSTSNLQPATTLRLRLVGPDQAGHMAELVALCESLGLSCSLPGEKSKCEVEFVGEKHGAGLEAEYEGCDALVLPSFTENFGGVVVDALAHGKPVIASRFTPWRELVEKGCGWWVDNAPESLAKTIEEAVALPREKLDEMGEAGRELVEAKYTWEAVVRTMVEQYNAISG